MLPVRIAIITVLCCAGLVVATPRATAFYPEINCTKSGSTLEIRLPAGVDEPELMHAFDGSIGVRFHEYRPEYLTYCRINGSIVDQNGIGAIALYEDEDGGDAPTEWWLRDLDWKMPIVVHNDPVDSFFLWSHATDPVHVEAAASPGAGLSLDQDSSDAEITFVSTPSVTTLDLVGSTDDRVDLTTGEASYPGDTRIWSWQGSDYVEGGGGSDTVYQTDDDAHDTIAGGGAGSDALWVSTADPSRGVRIDPAAPGGDGPFGLDDYGSFEEYVGSDGPDVFVAPPSGMNAVGRGEWDTYVSGPGDDVFDARDPRRPYSVGDDTVVYSDSPAGIQLSTSEVSRDVVAGHGDDNLFKVAGLVGTPEADTVDSATLRWVRPGDGDDIVATEMTDMTVVAEPTYDGDDAVTVAPGAVVRWDYSTRTAPLRLSADGTANDGEAGEADDIVGGRYSRIEGGHGDDLIVGDATTNYLFGGSGDDRLLGLGGGDGISGDEGDDLLKGGGGNDMVSGFVGNDVLSEAGLGVNGKDLLDGGAGVDSVSYARRREPVTITINDRYDDGGAGEADDVLDVEEVTGTAGADVIVGSGADEVLRGSAGDDALTGGGGADVLTGDEGDDLFHARDDTKDTLRGGPGSDRARVDQVDVRFSIEQLIRRRGTVDCCWQ